MPNTLWKDFDPLPCDEIQEKINFFILPLNQEQNYGKFMKFYFDEKKDQLQKLHSYYKQSHRTMEEKLIIKNTIDKINQDDPDFGFSKEGKCSWKLIYDWVYKRDGEVSKKRFLDQFYKV